VVHVAENNLEAYEWGLNEYGHNTVFLARVVREQARDFVSAPGLFFKELDE